MERDNDSKNYPYPPPPQPYLDLTYGGGSLHSEEYSSDANEPSYGGSNRMDHHHHNMMYTDASPHYGTLAGNPGGSEEYEEDEEEEEEEDEDDPRNRAIATVEHTGRWTREEHEAFLLGLQKYGKEWKKVAAQVRTRTVVQTRTHAQKYFQKLQKSLMDQQQQKSSKRPSRHKHDEAEEDEGDEDENDNEAMKMMALMSSAQQSGGEGLEDYIPNVTAFTSSLSASGGRGSRGGRGGSKRNLAKGGSVHSSHPQPLLPPPAVLPPAHLARRGSTATMNAAQVISTLSSAKTNDSNNTVTAVSSSHSVLPGTPARYHGFSVSDSNSSTPWPPSNAMKITAPDPSTQPRYPFPEPSPAATGKRKMAEITAAQMLVGAISGGGAKVPRSSTASSNLMFDGPPTPPMSANSTSGGGGERHLHLKDAPPLPPLFSGGSATTTSKPSLHIVNPESLGVTVSTMHRKGSPVTPWDGALEALVVQQSTNAATASSIDDPDGVVDSGSETAAPTCLPAQHPNRAPVDGYNRNPLHQAVCAQDDSTVKTLLDVIGPQDLNQVDSAGYAPLHSACAAGMSSNFSGESPPNAIVRLLLGAGCDPLRTDPLGNTPLHWAVRAADYDAVEQLLQHQGSNDDDNKKTSTYVDLPNQSGETSLHWALRLGMRGSHIVQLLLSCGACPHSLSKEFKRPIDVAAEGFLDDETSLAYARVQRRKKGSSNGGDTTSNGNGDGRKKSHDKEWKELLRRTRADRCATRAFFLLHSTSSRTLVLHHPECLDHHPKSISDWETPARVQTILQRIQQTASSDESGNPIFPHEIILSQDFDRANLELLSRVHSTEYLSFVNQLSKELERKVMAKGISFSGEKDDALDSTTTSSSSGIFSSTVVPFTPMVQRSMIKIDESSVKLSDNSDTSFSVGSLRAARRAAGAVQHAVDCVLSGKNRNAFCVVRPPGHHAGINGLLEGGESCGFCIFNNVAAGAMHAVAEYKDRCRRVAIVDIDVHHGNGTEEIVRRCNDPSTLFFFSIHLYDNEKDDVTLQKKKNQFTYKFYPGTGTNDDLHMNIINVPIMPLWKDPSSLYASAPKTHNTRKKTRGNASSSCEPVNDDSSEPGTPRVNSARLSDGESSTTTSANAASLPPPLATAASSSQGSFIAMPGRHSYRQAIQSRLLPALRAFNPDLILMSTGFDAVQGDVGNARHEKDKERMGLDLLPEDYAWTTRQILQIADICCQGRVVSILEGGYGRTPPTMGESGAATQGGTAAAAMTLDRSIFGDCAIRHLHAMVDPYDAEQRFE